MAIQITDYRSLIRKEGFRLTTQRQLILGAVGEVHGHSTPEQIYERVHGQAPAISRATIYRTLDFLLELGLVTVAQIKNNQTVYELACNTPHHHLICQQCDRVYEFRHDLAQPFFSGIEREFGFKVRTDHLMLFGVCEECRRAEEASKHDVDQPAAQPSPSSPP